MWDCVFQVAQQAGLPPARESDRLLAGSIKRLANIVLREWQAGCNTWFDLTAMNVCQAVTVESFAADRPSP